MNINERVQEEINRLLSCGEIGIQVAAYHRGVQVIDAWGGFADKERQIPVTADTLFNIWSVTKGITAVALHMQAMRGLVDYNAPVATYWPEFAANGKERGTVQDALIHRIGVPAIPADTTPELLCDWEWMAAAIAASAPSFEPGSANAYHSYTWGRIIAEIVRRTDTKKRPFCRFLQEEIFDPLDMRDVYVGLPASETDRVAKLYDPPPGAKKPGLIAAVPPAVRTSSAVWGRSDIRAACIPGEGAIASARGEARFWAMLAGGGQLHGVRLLPPERVRSFTVERPHIEGLDRVLGTVTDIGMGGFRVRGADHPELGSNPSLIYCPGAGGTIGWAIIDAELAVAICHNRMVPHTSPANDIFLPLTNIIHEEFL